MTRIKTCTKCGDGHLATLKFFPPYKRKKDGLSSWCRKCHREGALNYRQTEKGKERREQYYQRYRSTINGYLRHVYNGIKNRCRNSTIHNYHCYGGRGIKNKFKSSNEFVDYVINVLKVDPRGLTIDRINNDGHYEKGNIRFVTIKVNNNNKRKRTQ